MIDRTKLRVAAEAQSEMPSQVVIELVRLLEDAERELDALRAVVARVKSIASDHWDWKAGQTLARRLRDVLDTHDHERTDDHA